MDFDSARIRQSLDRLQTIVPCQYAQWLIEDRHNHDYQVIASVIPEGAEGYDTAHRTGVIGQVFRLEQSIMVPDVRNHPLYDPFDTEIDWELCFPVFFDGQMKGIVNLEGSGALELGVEAWERVCQLVEETTNGRPPRSEPKAGGSCMVESRRLVIQTNAESERGSDTAAVARAIARGGESTLLVGHYPDMLQGRGPSIIEASRQRLGVSYCYFGVEPRLDLLATGPETQEVLRRNKDWWNNCNGRYAFILLESDGESLESEGTV